MPVYNKRGILLLPKVIVLNPKDGNTGITGLKQESLRNNLLKNIYVNHTADIPERGICGIL